MNQDTSITSFIADWPDTSPEIRGIFTELHHFLGHLEETSLEFTARPGISYSLRAVPTNGEKPLFAMVDVIDDEPRWLSVCFYGQTVSDPEELGDYVPGGLLGEDGICFDLEKRDDTLIAYLKQRIQEAHGAVRTQ